MDQELELKKMDQERELYVATLTPAEQKMIKDRVLGMLADRSVIEAQQRAMGDWSVFFYEVPDVKGEAGEVLFLMSPKPLTIMEQKEYATALMTNPVRIVHLQATGLPGVFGSSIGSVTVNDLRRN